MADQINMNGLNLNDSQHAGPGAPPNGMQQGGGQRQSYVPPHARSGRGGPPTNGSMDGSAWGPGG